MLTNNLVQKISFLLPKKENLPMYVVQIVTLIFMIAVFGSNQITDPDTYGIIAKGTGLIPVDDWHGLGFPFFIKALSYISSISIAFLYKVQTIFYIFLLGKICLVSFNKKNIKLSVLLFIVIFYSPSLFVYEFGFTKDTLYLMFFTGTLLPLLLYIKNKKNSYYIIFFMVSILFVFTRINAYILIMPLLLYTTWLFISNNQKKMLSYKILCKIILILFFHVLLSFSLLFILNLTYRDFKVYPSSTLIYNDILSIITLGGSIRDKDIDYYAHKYIDRIGGIKGSTERTFWSEKEAQDFEKLNIDKQNEIIFLRYLLTGYDPSSMRPINPASLKKTEYKSRITSYEENRAYIKKVWLYALIDNPVQYLHHRFLYAQASIKGGFYGYNNNYFDKNKQASSFIITKYDSFNWHHISIWKIIITTLISSLLYFKFIKKYDPISIMILMIVAINISVLVFVIPVPNVRYFLVDVFLMTLLSARNSISLIYYACSKNKI